MKKIIKLLLCITCIFSLTGCGGDEKEPATNDSDKPGVTDKEKDNSKEKENNKYFDSSDEYIELANYDYKIKLPSNYKDVNKSRRTNLIGFVTKNEKEVSVLISTTKIYGEKLQNFSLNNIRGEFEQGRRINIRFVQSNDGEVTYNDQPVETTVDKKEALLDKGVASDGGGEVCNYAVYYFFLDEEKEYPCEFFVGSTELEPDELAEIAEEMIGMIEEVE